MSILSSTEKTINSLALGPEHEAFVSIALHISEKLDDSPRLSASLLAELLKTLRFLLKESNNEPTVDPLEQLLSSVV